jgi:lipoprotein-releasing system permease protein
MLGVATLIVVNSVMNGFSTKLRERLRAFLSDIVIESAGMEGFAGAEEKMARILTHPFLKDKIKGITPTLEIFAMLQLRWPNGETNTRTVKLIGIDPRTRETVGGWKDYLVGPVFERDPLDPHSDIMHAKHREEKHFDLPPAVVKHYELLHQLQFHPQPVPEEPDQPPPPTPPPSRVKVPSGIIVGHLIASFREKNVDGTGSRDRYVLRPGDEVKIITVSGALTGERIGEHKMVPVNDSFVVVDYFKSELSEYDSNYVFVPLDYLQHLRTMHNRVTSIQIKLNDYADAKAVVEELRAMFPHGSLRIETWEQKQGPLLHAIDIERGILNVLLFLIIAVAGFGILAIFSMIVAEKTRDIGILKALGASNGGVMKIFLGYGLLLGVVGAGLGTLLGLTLTWHINKIEQFLSSITGNQVFDRGIYYFNEIPTDIQVMMVLLVNAGAVAIAVAFSVLPALRAALLHPVRALRYE